MKKLKEKFEKIINILKKSLKKFPITIALIIIYTLIMAINLDFYFIDIDMIENLTKFVIIFSCGEFLIETLIEKNNIKKFIYSILSVVWSILMTYLLSKWQADINEIFMYRVIRILMCYCITTFVLAIYFSCKKSGKGFEEYVTQTFIRVLKSTFIYGVLAIGLAIVLGIFVYLILNENDYMLIERMEILLLGIYYVPTILYSFTEQEEVGKFAKVVIKYILGTLLMISYAIIYMYMVKILILRDMPSNQIFRILSVLFLSGLPIWTMNLYFDEDDTFDKINKKLPLLFIPFIFLQGYSISKRIYEDGFTELRYLCIILMIFEIIYVIMYLKKNKKMENILVVFIVLMLISVAVPYINMYNISNISQYKKLQIYKQKDTYTEEEKRKIRGAYYYLKSSSEGEKYIDELLTNDDITKITSMYNKYGDAEYIIASKEQSCVNIEGYSKLYEVDTFERGDSYTSSYNYDSINTSSIDFEDSNYETVLEVDLTDEINQYIENRDNIDEYFENNCEIFVDNSMKVVLTRISIEIDSENNGIKYLSASGYLLEK